MSYLRIAFIFAFMVYSGTGAAESTVAVGSFSDRLFILNGTKATPMAQKVRAVALSPDSQVIAALSCEPLCKISLLTVAGEPLSSVDVANAKDLRWTSPTDLAVAVESSDEDFVFYKIVSSKLVSNIKANGKYCAVFGSAGPICARDYSVFIADRRIYDLDVFTGYDKTLNEDVKAGEDFDLPSVGLKTARVFGSSNEGRFTIDFQFVPNQYTKLETDDKGNIEFVSSEHLVRANFSSPPGSHGLIHVSIHVGATLAWPCPIYGLSVSADSKITFVAEIGDEYHAIVLIHDGDKYKKILDERFVDARYSRIDSTTYNSKIGVFAFKTAAGKYSVLNTGSIVTVHQDAIPKSRLATIDGVTENVHLLTAY